jgi:hypothetical protein
VKLALAEKHANPAWNAISAHVLMHGKLARMQLVRALMAAAYAMVQVL